MVIKQFLKKLSGWDQKSPHEKAVSKYRLKSAVANIACLFPFSVGRLLSLSGSDKEQQWAHHYGATYEMLFRRFRYRPITLLEIGIGGYDHGLGGDSLLAWQAYFPFAKIVACDLVPKLELATRRTRVYTIDQSSAVDLARLTREHGPFDVVIDDGSHLSAHQIFTFRTLFDSVRQGGVYIIEDVATSFWQGKVGPYPFMAWDGRHIDDPEFSQTCVGYFLELSKYLNHTEFVDARGVHAEHVHLAQKIRRISFEHNLIVIEKRP